MKLWRDGKVAELGRALESGRWTIRGEVISATDSATRYQVNLALRDSIEAGEGGCRTEGSCTCRDSERWAMCKHLVAALKEAHVRGWLGPHGVLPEPVELSGQGGRTLSGGRARSQVRRGRSGARGAEQRTSPHQTKRQDWH